MTDILEAINRIQRYSAKGEDEFKRNELVQTWVIHHIQIVGEAASRLSTALQESQPDVPWTQIVGMRNIVVHEYFGLDLEEVWNTVAKDLPILREQLLAVSNRLAESESPD